MLSAPQMRFIAALLTERTPRAAILKSEVREKTAYQWLREPEFQAAVADARAKLMESTINVLAGAASQAAARLSALLDNPNTPLPVLLDCIRMALSYSIDQHEKQRLIARLEKLEQLNGGTGEQAEPWTTTGPLLLEGSSQ